VSYHSLLKSSGPLCIIIWEPGGTDRKVGAVSASTSQSFPYLAMELFWSRSGALNFCIHLKDNQCLQYLNQGSTHTWAVFAAIPHGVLGRLARLTSIMDEFKDLQLNQLYPKHAQALLQAHIAPDHYPALREMIEDNNHVQLRSQVHHKRDMHHQVFFCLGVSGWHLTPVHVILKRLRNQFNLKWPHISMSYHRFANLCQMYQ
jgi:hypothetical protein